MTGTRPAISARGRTILGKKVKQLRRQGLLPAVVYGPAVQGVQTIALDTRDFERLYTRTGMATLLDLQLEGQRARPVLIHQVQRDATRRNLVHVDFLAPDMLAELTLAVPLALTGEAPAVEAANGVVTQLVSELQVTCLPDRIPAALEVDLSGLAEIDAQLTAGDIPLPEGVSLASPQDELIVKIDPPAVDVEAEEAAAAEAAVEGEPAAEAEADAGADDRSDEGNG